MEPGDHLVLAVEQGELRAWPLKTAIAEIQALVREYVPDDVDLAEELIVDRRREAPAE